jgi:hypothetical protein
VGEAERQAAIPKQRSDAGTPLTYPPLFNFPLLGDAARQVAERFRKAALVVHRPDFKKTSPLSLRRAS